MLEYFLFFCFPTQACFYYDHGIAPNVLNLSPSAKLKWGPGWLTGWRTTEDNGRLGINIDQDNLWGINSDGWHKTLDTVLINVQLLSVNGKFSPSLNFNNPKQKNMGTLSKQVRRCKLCVDHLFLDFPLFILLIFRILAGLSRLWAAGLPPAFCLPLCLRSLMSAYYTGCSFGLYRIVMI